MFNMITGVNESKALTKHISFKCKCKFDGKKCNSNQSGTMTNVDVSVKIQKTIACAKKITFGIKLHVAVKMLSI